MDKKAKLVYIISQGHSGSTLLDFLIGSIPGTFSTGELADFPWQVYRTNKEGASLKEENICTCRKSFFECEIWGEIIKYIEKNKGIDFRKNPYSFRLAINRSNIFRKKRLIYKILTKLFYEISYFGFTKKISLIYSFLYRRSISNNWFLFDTIYNITGNEYIVDSTKNPLRFSLLHIKRPQNVKLIILIRELYGVATSGVNYGRDLDLEKSAKTWLKFYNKNTYSIIKNIDNLDYLIIKYEELTKKPEIVREKISIFLGLPKTFFVNKFITKDYHLVKGNPMRYKDEFSIKYDERWKRILDEDQINILKKFQDKLLQFFK